jgi:hypothetical protein
MSPVPMLVGRLENPCTSPSVAWQFARIVRGYDPKRAGQLAMHGLRPCVEELSRTETAERADGNPGRQVVRQ